MTLDNIVADYYSLSTRLTATSGYLVYKSMKKIIISLALVGMLVGFAPAVKAEITPQMIQSAQQSPELKAQLIQLIVQMIAVLQEQLKVIIAQEAALAQQNTTLNQIVQNTQQIVQNTAPVSNVGSATPAVLNPAPVAVNPVVAPIPSPTCAVLAESLQPDRHDVAVPIKISWTSTDAVSGVIEGDFHGSNSVKYQLIQNTADNVSAGYNSVHSGMAGVDVRGTFTGNGGTTHCYYSMPQ